MAPASLGECLGSIASQSTLNHPDRFDPITQDEVYDMIRHMKDPEHPELTLEQLRVVNYDDVTITPTGARIEYKKLKMIKFNFHFLLINTKNNEM